MSQQAVVLSIGWLQHVLLSSLFSTRGPWNLFIMTWMRRPSVPLRIRILTIFLVLVWRNRDDELAKCGDGYPGTRWFERYEVHWTWPCGQLSYSTTRHWRRRECNLQEEMVANLVRSLSSLDVVCAYGSVGDHETLRLHHGVRWTMHLYVSVCSSQIPALISTSVCFWNRIFRLPMLRYSLN